MDTTEINTLSPAEEEELAAALKIASEGFVPLRTYRLAVGRALHTIKRLWELKGVCFKDSVNEQLGIPYTSAIRYMRDAEDEVGTILVPDEGEEDVEQSFEIRHDDTPDTQAAQLTRQRELEKAKVVHARITSQNKGTVTVHVSGLDQRLKSKLSQLKKTQKESFDKAAHQFIQVLLMTSPAQVLAVLNQLQADTLAEEEGSRD